MKTQTATFSIGQIVIHKRFHYRGVIVDVDPHYALDEQWYALMATSRPPKDKPWYHVLVDNASHTTYVAERNLVADHDKSSISHPRIDSYFDNFTNGEYHFRERIQ